MQGGFLEERQKNPVGLGAVIVLHAAVLTAVILAPPEYVPNPWKTITAYPVKEDPPPPEHPVLPKPNAQPTKPESVDHTKPVVDTTALSESHIELTKFTGVEPRALPEPDPLPLPAPDPVFVSARPDPRAGDMQPPYPTALARAEIEGKAEIRILIGTDGRVKMVELVSATDPAFFEATRQQALRHWRFVPATRDGVPVESWRTMTVRFQLQG
jgi:protein TonB